MLRGLERGALDGVCVHGGERGVVDLAGADADHALNGLDEDLPVSDFAGAGGRQDGLDARLDVRLRAHHLDLDLLVELHDDRVAAVLAHDLLLTPVAAHATESDSCDAGLEQRRLDLGQAFGPNDGSDEVHGENVSPVAPHCQRNHASDARIRHHSSHIPPTAYCVPSRTPCKLCNQAGAPHPVGLAASGGWRNTHWVSAVTEHKDDRLTVDEDTAAWPPCSPPPAWKSPSPPPVTREGGLHVRTKAHRAACRAFLRGGRGTGAVPAAP